MNTRRKMTAILAMAAVVPLTFTACGSGGGSGATSGGDVKTLTVLDSYNNEPDKGISRPRLTSAQPRSA